ncbi:sensor domain-containing diguanylate cyclase [Mycolicibacterium sp. CH28]|uniref:diguanylate cyclase domain-containing protein n=1 Tax=Mycolicibacterium sp. CH28 TaxID=2512237 RepID=UPI001081EDED|nr:diguanylate cyclase [Mycolicibacterium sp. CH28]TGD86752.1 sensor domain-containing diguanylate cyclase [Mycolicibacterium sp. CH28]
MGDELLDWFAESAVAAFLCRRDGDDVEIVSRTPECTAVVGPGPGQLAETALLAGLGLLWPGIDRSPEVISLPDAPDWQCTLQALDDPPTSWLGILRLTTARQRHNEVFFSIAQALPDIVARLDRNHRHVYINPRIERETGIPVQLFIGKSKRELGLPPDLVAQWEPLVDRVLHSEEPAEEEQQLPTIHGVRTFLTRVVPERSPDGEVRTVLSTSYDITQLKSLQQQLAELARTDPLTSVLNRRGFSERIEAELARQQDGDGQLSLLLLDVNDFKSVNDTYGHFAGDNVLIAIGEALQQEVGPHDFVARLGGDEFCVALVDADATDADAVADRIRRRIGGLGPGDRCPCAVSVSVGLATATADERTADLMTRVDRQMYREKSSKSGPA